VIHVLKNLKKYWYQLSVTVTLNFPANVTYIFTNHHLSRGLASQAVFHCTFNINQFKLTRGITYDQYVYVVNSNTVPFQKLAPDTYLTLSCDFIRQRNIRDKKFYKNCVIQSERVPVMWSTYQMKHCHSIYDALGTLLHNRDDWWCWLCARPLFILPTCIRLLQRT
jgi:hypothetical protein